MSRFYEMTVEIAAHRPDKADAIREAARQEWPFAEWDEHDGLLTAFAEGDLCGGESERGFADRLATAIWKANRAYCAVSVRSVYLEDLPCETFVRNEEDYARLIGQEPSQTP